MRAHGVPKFPDPPASFDGKFPGSSPSQLGVSESQLQTAINDCPNLLPAQQGEPPLTAAQQQDYLKTVACMRSHGFPSFPDPVFSSGQVSFPPPPAGIDTASPQFVQAKQTCEKFIPAGFPDSN